MQKIYVIKIGGNVIDDPLKLKQFLLDFSKIDRPKVLAHGGGKVASDLAKRLGISQAMVNGRRITDAETLKIAVMVYAGLLNKQIVAQLQALNVNAIGLCGADLNVLSARKREVKEIDYGFAGDLNLSSVNASVIETLLSSGVVPVFSAITHDGNGQLLNTNADTIACFIAKSLVEKFEVKLHYCFEKKGVLLNSEDDSSVIPKLNRSLYRRLSSEGVISKGMLPKLDGAFEALMNGVAEVKISCSDAILNVIDDENEGTRLVG